MANGIAMKKGTVKRKPTNPIIIMTKMNDLLSLEPSSTDFYKVADRVQQIPRKDRRLLLSMCERVFAELELRKDDTCRVAAAKVIVALMPDSIDNIERWLNTKTGRYIYEVHFSLFCFLDQVPNLCTAREYSGEILSLVEKYLREVKSKSAYAAWMAGDLLGDHWEITESFPVLMRIAKEARFVAGRKSTLHGFRHMIEKLVNSDPRKESIVALLCEISNNDRSLEVRYSAKFLLKDIKLKAL